MREPENRNMLVSRILVDELIRLGVAGVCISPGSRSTSLAIAISERSDLKRFLILDERSAAYFALGLAQATQLPAVLVCTSGTAAANYLPALVEASQAGVPLIAITADRPAGLRGSGANQTIDQVKLYGDSVRWYTEFPAPGPEFTPGKVRELRTVVDRLHATASGQRPGPVHLNVQFEKPLEPTPDPRLAEESSGDYSRLLEGSWGPGAYSEQVLGRAGVLPPTFDTLPPLLLQHRRGVIVCGPRCQGDDFPAAVSQLGKALGYPILADVLSGVRVHLHADRDSTFGLYENYVGGIPQSPDLVIQFGSLPVSTRLQEYLGRAAGAPRIHVSADGAWADDRWLVTHRVVADPTEMCRSWVNDLPDGIRADAAWMEMWMSRERLAEEVIAEYCARETFEGAWVRELVESADDGSAVFLGNSLPVRHADEYVPVQSKRLEFFANRGASGIDGTLSTALGLAAGRSGGVLAILGDLALLHDLNALLVLKRCALPVKLVVLNNDGGGLFLRLPVAAFEPPFTELFHTPHGRHFGEAARMFELPYRQVAADSKDQTGFASALRAAGPVLIEIESDARAHERARTQIHQQIMARSRDAMLPEIIPQENQV